VVVTKGFWVKSGMLDCWQLQRVMPPEWGARSGIVLGGGALEVDLSLGRSDSGTGDALEKF